MTNREFSTAYFAQALAIAGELEGYYEDEVWHLVVRRGQEIVELILKGFLRQAGVEIPRMHDVGHLVRQEQHRLPAHLAPHMDRLISLSRQLRQERETSFYGDEAQELPPSMLYTKVDADHVYGEIQWLLTLVPRS